MNTKLISLTAAAFAVPVATSSGAVLVDFNLGTQIDPSGGNTVNAVATNATPETTVEAVPGLQVLNDARQSSKLGGAILPSSGDNTFAFTDPLTADFLIDQQAGARGNSGSVSGGGGGTSSGEAIKIINTTASVPVTFSIDFGSFDFGADGLVGGGDDSFNATANPVDAAAFTISAIRAGTSATASFFDNSGVLLSTQVAAAPIDSSINAYFGLVDAGGIGRVDVTRTSSGDAQTTNLGDIAFGTIIPEPASAGAVGLLGLVGLRRRR